MTCVELIQRRYLLLSVTIYNMYQSLRSLRWLQRESQGRPASPARLPFGLSRGTWISQAKPSSPFRTSTNNCVPISVNTTRNYSLCCIMIHSCLSLPVPIARDSSATQSQISLQALFLNAARVPADLGTSSRLHPGFLQKQPCHYFFPSRSPNHKPFCYWNFVSARLVGKKR